MLVMTLKGASVLSLGWRGDLAVETFLYGGIVGHFGQTLLIDGFAGLFLLYHAKHTIIQMLVKFLGIVEHGGAC